MTTNAPRRAVTKAPRRRFFGGFGHLLARRFQNYLALCVAAAHRKKKRAVDIDFQKSKEGTPLAAHWPTVGQNKLHDPHGKIAKSRHLDTLTDAEFLRLEGPSGQKTHLLLGLLHYCEREKVRVEAEAKTQLSAAAAHELMDDPIVQRMDKAGLLQFKTLAFVGYKQNVNAAAARLRPLHDAGATTIMSFTDFGRRRGISKKAAWPVTDYTRGRVKWVA